MRIAKTQIKRLSVESIEVNGTVLWCDDNSFALDDTPAGTAEDIRAFLEGDS